MAFDQTNQLARTQDPLGRPSGIALGPDYTVAYGYDPLGRFASVSSSVESVQSVVQYAYLPGFDLVSGWSNDLGLAVTRAFEPERNLIAEIDNRWGGADISTFAYDNDPAGRRTKRVDSASITNDFAYNLRSELIDAVMGTNSFKYAYDPIGNREWTQMNANTNWYTVNVLNQYTHIVEGGASSPPLSYDPDGNLTNDGRFAYAWDAENRLISVVSNGTMLLVNTYDYMSRRVLKANATYTNTYIYDGWNVVSEFTPTPPNTQTKYYVWGLDLSGTLQGAGGIGGLLSVHMSHPSHLSHFPSYDANGNVTDLVDTNGVLAAHYEYDPYGNETTASGPLAEENPFRFSTKYWDEETGFLYYGYRYYNSELGRWLNREPLGEAKEVNLYIFVRNRPTLSLDILGLFLVDPSDPGAGVIDDPSVIAAIQHAMAAAGFVHGALKDRLKGDVETFPGTPYETCDCPAPYLMFTCMAKAEYARDVGSGYFIDLTWTERNEPQVTPDARALYDAAVAIMMAHEQEHSNIFENHANMLNHTYQAFGFACNSLSLACDRAQENVQMQHDIRFNQIVMEHEDAQSQWDIEDRPRAKKAIQDLINAYSSP